MKYKLKKDLPFAQAGEQARCFYGSSVFNITYRMDSVDFNLTSEEYIDKLIRDGWIEEVKPVELYVRYDHFTTLDEMKYWDKSKFIKVKKVIE